MLCHHTHPAATKLLDDAVVGDGLANKRVGVRHSDAIIGFGFRLSQRIEVIRVEVIRSDLK